MADTAQTPVVVPANAGIIDALQAAARYTVVLIGAVTAILGFLNAHDIAGLMAYVQANGGQITASVAGLIAIGTAAYGVLKSHRRGSQIATVAASPRVPASIATTK